MDRLDERVDDAKYESVNGTKRRIAPAKYCDGCGITEAEIFGPLKQCGRCRTTLYYGYTCQEASGRKHSKVCAPAIRVNKSRPLSALAESFLSPSKRESSALPITLPDTAQIARDEVVITTDKIGRAHV